MWTHEFAVLDVIAMTTLPMCWRNGSPQQAEVTSINNMSLDVAQLQSNIDLQSIGPSIALATFFLSGLTVRSEVEEQGKEIKRQI